jgi:hypothetical protein
MPLSKILTEENNDNRSAIAIGFWLGTNLRVLLGGTIAHWQRA